MKNPDSLSARKDMVVLEIVEVRASSGNATAGLADTDAISFLQNTNFVAIKPETSNSNHVKANSPRNETFFLFEQENERGESSMGSFKKPFRLIRISDKTRTVIDQGYTIFVQKITGDPGQEISIIAIGDEMKDLELTCCVATPDKVELDKSLIAATMVMTRQRTRRSGGGFALSDKSGNKTLNHEVSATTLQSDDRKVVTPYVPSETSPPETDASKGVV